jgi:penicillin-binding protein A
MKKRYTYNHKKIDIKDTIEKRYNIVVGIIIFFVLLIITNLFYVQIINRDYYLENMYKLQKDIVAGTSAPRGRIYDRNGKIIVDNKPIKIISYKKISGTTSKQEVEMAYLIGSMIEVKYKINEDELKSFWILNNKKEADNLITKEEYKLLKERKLTSADILKFKKERITEDIILNYSETDKEACYIYLLMNKGYYYSEKIIKKVNITEEEYALVSENLHLLKGFNTRLDWNREYVYGDVFRYILGNVSTTETGLPYELKDYYLSKGYSLNDRVGVTNLEYQYEEYLRGEKDLFQLSKDDSLTLYQEGKRGNDIYLTIDIELQKAVEEILIEEILKAKDEANTKYYNRSYVIITRS